MIYRRPPRTHLYFEQPNEPAYSNNIDFNAQQLPEHHSEGYPSPIRNLPPPYANRRLGACLEISVPAAAFCHQLSPSICDPPLRIHSERQRPYLQQENPSVLPLYEDRAVTRKALSSSSLSANYTSLRSRTGVHQGRVRVAHLQIPYRDHAGKAHHTGARETQCSSQINDLDYSPQ